MAADFDLLASVLDVAGVDAIFDHIAAAKSKWAVQVTSRDGTAAAPGARSRVPSAAVTECYL
jgi:hypothetical protein